MFVPVGNHYKKEGLIDEKHRYNMLHIAIKKFDKLEISDIELNLDRTLMPIEIFDVINKMYSTDEIHFILGADNLYKINEQLQDKYNYIVIKRKDFEISHEIANKNNIKILDNENYAEVSATNIRKKLKQSYNNLENELPKGVLKYILDKKLYL